LSKKFASSCSPIDEDKIQILGDFFDDIKEILVAEYNVKKKYILDKD
jgi:translation initiation factor 1 (eIF-1/SUI1)